MARDKESHRQLWSASNPPLMEKMAAIHKIVTQSSQKLTLPLH
jgi:hypothetical protein